MWHKLASPLQVPLSFRNGKPEGFFDLKNKRDVDTISRIHDDTGFFNDFSDTNQFEHVDIWKWESESELDSGCSNWEEKNESLHQTDYFKPTQFKN